MAQKKQAAPPVKTCCGQRYGNLNLNNVPSESEDDREFYEIPIAYTPSGGWDGSHDGNN